MFWGLILKPNRKYTQTANKSFHISLAALNTESLQNATPNQVFVNYENQKFLICTLRKDTCEQVMLDLNFAEGDEISFLSVGSGQVTLSGYVIDDDSPYMLGDDEEEDSEVENIDEDLRNTLNKKANANKGVKNGAEKAKAGKAAVDEEEDDDEEDDSDWKEKLDGADDDDSDDEQDDDDDEEDDDDDEEDDDDDDDDNEDEEDSDEEEEVQQPKAKQAKLEKPHNQQNGVAKEVAAVQEKKGKKDKKDKKEGAKAQAQQQQQQQPQKAGGERTLTGGVKVEDQRVGNGAEAKVGKRAQVYYEGRLKSNNKVFDSLKQGAGFKFAIGRGEVIKGWDVGVAGMKVGGKRRITCPPHMGYGARGSPPTIPPNSTLVFDVELKGVN